MKKYVASLPCFSFCLTETDAQAVPLMAHLPEFKALEGDEEGRKAAYDKFIRRQKVRRALCDWNVVLTDGFSQERQREGGSEDGGSTGTKRKDYRRSAPEKSSTSRGHRSSHRRDDERETKVSVI